VDEFANYARGGVPGRSSWRRAHPGGRRQLRVGTFKHFASRDEHDKLRLLATRRRAPRPRSMEACTNSSAWRPWRWRRLSNRCPRAYASLAKPRSAKPEKGNAATVPAPRPSTPPWLAANEWHAAINPVAVALRRDLTPTAERMSSKLLEPVAKRSHSRTIHQLQYEFPSHVRKHEGVSADHDRLDWRRWPSYCCACH